jgi:phosphate transport system substrate-binding protein
MGTVFEVEQIVTGARRALKVMHAKYASDQVHRARFVAEARLAAVIPSDHVAQVLDAGHDQTTRRLYIVMELLSGVTLSSELRRTGVLAWHDVVEIMRQLAHALSAAHALGIVHRDLKPANIFLSRSRHVGMHVMVKVIDFGIAQAIANGNRLTDAPFLGTPAWMAPEQGTAHEAIGPAADVWALGLLAFLMLTGKHYFPSANEKDAPIQAVWREVTSDALVSASKRAAQLGQTDKLPAEFDSWFARCVDRDPKARFQNAATAYEELARLRPPQPIDAVPPSISVGQVPPTPSPPMVRADLEATAAETPRPLRVLPGEGPSATVAGHVPTGTTPPTTFAAFAMGAAALIMVCAIAIVLVVRGGSRERSTAVQPASIEPTGMFIRLHGSNTIGAELAPALAEEFLHRHSGAATVVTRRTAPDELVVEARGATDRPLAVVEVHAHGSSTAFEDLGAGKCDIGMASRRIRPEEVDALARLGNLASAASEHVIGLDGIAVIVNPKNPISSLTTGQIAAVFAGRARTWDEVGGVAEPIVVFARDDKSGTFDTFKHLVLGSDELVADAKRFESSEALSDAVAADDRAIGFIGLPYVRSAKAVMVQTAPSSVVLPSPMTVATEDYPLARRLYFYVPLGASSAARDFVDFALSEDGQRIVQSAGFVDLRPKCDANAARCSDCPSLYRDAVRGGCRVSTDFRFDLGDTQLDTRALRDLQRVSDLMSRSSQANRSIVLLGFSDSTGARSDNMSLSQRRAGVVAEQLRARGLHVDLVRGFGPDMPIADNSTDEGRQRNRRVEIWVR